MFPLSKDGLGISCNEKKRNTLIHYCFQKVNLRIGISAFQRLMNVEQREIKINCCTNDGIRCRSF